jgi:hypothetical protein
VRERGRSVERAGKDEREHRVQPLAPEPDAAQHRHQNERPDHAQHDTDRHLDGELAHDDQERRVVVRGELDHAQHQRDPGRVVDAGLTFERRPRTAPDLAASQH